jgi:hypothetical protein
MLDNPLNRKEQDVTDDIFRETPDDGNPVTRGEMRQIVRDVRNDLRWAVVITVVGTQALSHVELPPVAGFIGGAAVIGLGIIKLAVARG